MSDTGLLKAVDVMWYFVAEPRLDTNDVSGIAGIHGRIWSLTYQVIRQLFNPLIESALEIKLPIIKIVFETGSGITPYKLTNYISW